MAVQDEPETQTDDQLEDAASESQPLLTSSGPAASPLGQQAILQQAGDSGQPKPLTAAKAEKQDVKTSQANSDKKDLGQCRICLEEDAVSNLETPCGCIGTSAYAHKDCIQKWINEKHDTTCEVCDQQYRGSYTLPPPPPPSAGEQLHVVAPLGSLYLTVEGDRVAEQLLADVYDEWDDNRQPAVSGCFSIMMFVLFLVFLHSTMTISVPPDGSSSSSSPGSSPAIDPSPPVPGSGAAGLAAGASLFLLWLLTKLFLVVLPLLMVMRLAARAQEQAAEAAAGTAPGSDEPAAAGSSGSSHYYSSMLARLATGGSGSAGAAAGSSGGVSGVSLTDLEMEVLQARRAAFSRLGRDPTFWAPAAAGGTAGSETAAAAAGQQQQAATVAEQRMMAAVRAMVRAAVASAARQGRAAEGSSDGASTPTRLSGVV